MTNSQLIYLNFLNALTQIDEPDYKVTLNYYPPFKQTYKDGYVEEHGAYTEMYVYHRPTDKLVYSSYNDNDIIREFETATNSKEVYVMEIKALMRDCLIRGK